MSSPSVGSVLRRGETRLRCLRAIVRDTQRALADVVDALPAAAHPDPAVSTSVQEIGGKAARPLVVFVLGRDCSSRARLVNTLLGEEILPTSVGARKWRWIRLQYGSGRQVQLNLNNSEFELVEELECQRAPWTVMPEKDLQRREPSDLSTIMDIELNSPFLKDGLKLIVPPDLDPENKSLTYEELKQTYEEFYAKRMSVLKQFTPICFYAINCTGKNIFSEHSCEITRRMSQESSRSEEDFWKTHNMYYMARVPDVIDFDRYKEKYCDNVRSSIRNKIENKSNDYVFSAENCLDLQQVKELYPNLQIYFILFSDSSPMEDQSQTSTCVHQSENGVFNQSQHSAISVESEQSNVNLETEVTESTEEQLYHSQELPESDQELKDNKNSNVILRSSIMENGVNRDLRNVDTSQRLLEQNAFMYELMDQWRLVCCAMSKGDPKNYWMILDDAEAIKSCDRKPLAPFISKAIHKVSHSTEGKRSSPKKERSRDSIDLERKLVVTRNVLVGRMLKYVAEMVHNYLLDFCTKLSEVQIKLLQQFILMSFDMAREIQVVPKKIEYVALHEQQLYESINEKFSEGDKKQELVCIMQQVLQDMKREINAMDWSVDDLPCHQDNNIVVSNSVFYGTSTPRPEPMQYSSINAMEQPVSDVEQAISYDTYDFRDYDIITSEETASFNSIQVPNAESLNMVNSQSVSDVTSDSSQISLIRIENESSVTSSVFARIMDFKSNRGKCTSNSQMSIKEASLDVQKTVLTRLSRQISLRLVKFVDCLSDSYFGTLQRCLESLEASCREELGGQPASEAMRQMLLVARQVDLESCASFSVLRTLVEHLRRLVQRLKVGGGGLGGGACCVLSPIWRRDIALHTLQTLSATRLARLISAQILEKLTIAHEGYQTRLSMLAAALESRIHHTEDVKLAIRKRYAPGFARLCLESTSMCDVLQHGMPELGREIGRGQYGVVYACKGGWGGHEPCAIKSVLPSDERHFNELAMEFFYTRSIPAHPRIVRLWGSAVERHASGSATVLLVTERKKRDLYCAVRTSELPFTRRMRIALDIVEGIRYLHSLGLVHRDIKMKNVLLDHEDRASLTDLGFCMPEALMSGSIVGTPVHMAPELLSGEYDSSVDVYAFGILFWYLCAGNIKLPSAFELFQNKEQLWSKVRRGLRPERLPHFSEECWQLMESCWASEPSKRALLGDVQPILERVLEQGLQREETPARAGSRESLDFRIAWSQDDNSLNFSQFNVV